MIAIIPARGGSKGLPGKNIKELNGKPLIAYTIEAAQQASCVSKVLVSTDSEDIAEVSREFGAEVPFMRPDKLATDESKVIDTYLYVINQLEKRESIDVVSLMVCLPTCPLRKYYDIEQAYRLFEKNNADSVISYTSEDHPIFWHKFITEEGKLENIFEETITNRQDLRKTYYPNGAIYIFKSDLLKKGTYYSENTYGYVMPRERSVDIDTIDDFRYAEFLMKNDDSSEKL